MTAWLALWVFLASAGLQFTSVEFTNDHFDRISRARQIAEYGELPFRDFLDPGYFATLYSSALLQRVLGHNLLGEAALDIAFISAGFALVFVLASEISGSLIAGGAVTALAVVAAPRLYDYDKALFYPLGVFLCWKVIDRPTLKNIILVGAGTALALLFRYDNGVYIGCAAIVAFAAMYWRNPLRLVRATVTFVVAVLALLTPALIFVAWNGGLRNASDQIVDYAIREGRRTSLFEPPGFVIDQNAPLFVLGEAEPVGPLVKVRWARTVLEPARLILERQYRLADGRFDHGRTWLYRLLDASAPNVQRLVEDSRIEDTAGLDRGTFSVTALPEPDWERWRRSLPLLRRVQVLPGVFSQQNAVAWWYSVLVAVPLISVAALSFSRFRAPGPGGTGVHAKVLSAAALCGAVDAFILRDPIQARAGAVTMPAAVLVAWVIGARGGPSKSRSWRLVSLTAGLVILALTSASAGALQGWPSRLARSGALLNPAAVVVKSSWALDELRASPPPLGLLPAGRVAGIVRYLRSCTKPNDRVMVTWFAPEVYYFSGRRFAGGMVVFFGEHWSQDKYQSLMLTRLEAHPPAVVLTKASTYDGFRSAYPSVDRYLKRHYELVTELDFGDSDADLREYGVFVNRARRPSGIAHRWGLPCFSQ